MCLKWKEVKKQYQYIAQIDKNSQLSTIMNYHTIAVKKLILNICSIGPHM